MTRWLKSSGLESPDLSHLKRIRKQNEITTLLLCVSLSPTPPPLPTDLGLTATYTVPVPATVALTMTSLQLKSSLWPTTYAPRRKGEMEPWTRGRARWAWDAMRVVLGVAGRAKAEGEVSWFELHPKKTIRANSPLML